MRPDQLLRGRQRIRRVSVWAEAHIGRGKRRFPTAATQHENRQDDAARDRWDALHPSAPRPPSSAFTAIPHGRM